MTNIEIEVRFLEIDKLKLIEKLHSLGAVDKGEDLLEEIIFYKQNGDWSCIHKHVKIRKTKYRIVLSYKHTREMTATGTEEIEFQFDSMEKGKEFLEKIGLKAFRYQEKRRHKFILDDVIIDIDTWPKIPTYVELEGQSEEALMATAEKLELVWSDSQTTTPASIIEDKYHIKVRELKYFTFDRIE